MEDKKNKSIIDKFWDLLASVKLAIIIFALIALTSIVGTILEQGADEARNLQILAKLFGESVAPSLYTIFNKLGFMDMYHSWWFISILILFSVNLIICSLDRLPKVWKLISEPMAPSPEEKLRKFLITREVVIQGPAAKVRDTVADALKQLGFKSQEVTEEKGFQFFSQKGPYSRLGVFITHCSILVILCGAIIGLRFGFKGYVNVPEGTATNLAFADRGTRNIPLGFEVRCDNFDAEFYGMSDMPKEYRSWLTILKDGREVLKKSIVVNDPLTYEGITFYQASYGFMNENIDRGIFLFRLISANGQSSDIQLRLGDSFHIQGSNISGKILNFSPALRIDEHGHAFTYANQMNNPAVLIDFSESGARTLTGWILKRHPETWQLPNGDRVEFLDYWGVEFTGLQVRKDPGVWIVYFGCFAMSAGLFIAFFMSHRKIWVKLVEEKNSTRILVGATANKNRAAFERKVDTLLSLLGRKEKGEK
ncbi:MAG: cytochrome c biogenesis protein ResB [Thermodesulfovibrionales bacterium]|nr:cytochrome c biogenesis protein ResB [Thermodesulfovibrionales bacterium]